MRIRYTRRAQADLDAIYTYLEQRAPAAAQSVKSLIERRVTGLADFPFIGPETVELDVRELTIVRYPYKVYYKVAGEEVWIIHIRDARRRPWEGGE